MSKAHDVHVRCLRVVLRRCAYRFGNGEADVDRFEQLAEPNASRRQRGAMSTDRTTDIGLVVAVMGQFVSAAIEAAGTVPAGLPSVTAASVAARLEGRNNIHAVGARTVGHPIDLAQFVLDALRPHTWRLGLGHSGLPPP